MTSGLSANYLGSRRIRYSTPKSNVVGALMQYGVAERRMIAGAAVTKVLGEFPRRILSANSLGEFSRRVSRWVLW